jgi:hypothetical protein
MRRVSPALKAARGTLRPDRVRPRVSVPAGSPDAPPGVSDAVRRQHADLVAALADAATKADGPVLFLTAQALAEVDEHTAVLEAEGYVYVSGKRGMRRPHPSVALRDAAWRRALAGLRALGLSPTDRHRISAPEPAPFADLSRYR